MVTTKLNYMKCFVLTVVGVLFSLVLFSQKKNKVLYGDTSSMMAYTGSDVYFFKNGIKDGHWVAYYDSSYTKKAAACIIKEGKKEGMYFFWSENKSISEKIEYKNGMMDGLSKSLWKNPQDGVIYENIKKFKKGVLMEEIKAEW